MGKMVTASAGDVFGLFVMDVVTFLFACLGLREFMKSDYANQHENCDGPCPNGYTVTEYWGLLAAVLLFPFSTVICLAFNSLVNKGNYSGVLRTFVVLVTLGTKGVFLIVWRGSKVSHAYFNEKAIAVYANFLCLFLGTYMLIAATQLALALLPPMVGSNGKRARSESAAVSLKESTSALFKTGTSTAYGTSSFAFKMAGASQSKRALVVVGLLFYTPTLFFACTVAPSAWDYLSSADPKKNMPAWWANDGSTLSPEGGADSPWLTTLYIKASDQVYMKVFPDVALYYGYLFLITLGGGLACVFPSVDQFYHTTWRPFVHLGECARAAKHSRSFAARVVGGWTADLARVTLSIGEGLVLAATAAFFVCLVTYLVQFRDWQNVKGKGFPAKSEAEVAARTLGTVGNVLIGLLFLPASRGAAWSSVFGVSWEAGIAWHRILGRTFLLVIVAHMLCWWKVYDEEGFSWTQVYTVLGKYPLDGQSPTSPTYFSDNFTIPLVNHMFWVSFFCLGVLSLYPIRRKFFELFYYAHYMAIPLAGAVLLHAASAWYFVTGSLSLWFLDRALRFLRGTRHTTIVSAKVVDTGNGPITELTVTAPGFGEYAAGQFAFLNFPAVSATQWHPFTISSAPSDGMLTFHIKSMGDEQFTGRLATLMRAEDKPGRVVLSVDGPYGLPVDTSKYTSVLLVAGGIGFTPCHSLLRSMMAAGRSDKVRVVWAVRDDRVVTPFEHTLKDFVSEEEGQGEGAALELYNTQHTRASSSMLLVPTKGGRPDLRKQVSSLAIHGRKGLIFVCGPQGMVDTCKLLATEFGVSLHTETFEL